MGIHLPPIIASFLTLAFIVFLFRRDIREKPDVSGALWLPLIWLVFSCSRAFSQWLNIFGLPVAGAPSLEEGSPLDACFYFALIIAGFYVLNNRQVHLSEIVRNNRWLVAFLLYCFISIAWSDFPFVAFKRWIKILGHPIMALIVLTEPDPKEAVKRLMKRCAYVVVPVSILFIKYYPQLGRLFDPWTGMGMNNGIAENKNMLGADCLILGFFFFWYLLQIWQTERNSWRRNELRLIAGFLIGIWWLFSQAHSATSFISLLIGALIVVFVGIRSINKNFIGTYILAALVLLAVAELTFGVSGRLSEALGRESTLSGRTELWTRLLELQTNPILGTGFESFWLGERLTRLEGIFYFVPNEAHNGYLEIYLTLGLLGLFMMIALFIATFWKIRPGLWRNFEWGRFRLGFLAAIVVYNWTEAGFKTLHPIWFMFYIIAMDYPRPRLTTAPPSVGLARSEEEREFVCAEGDPKLKLYDGTNLAIINMEIMGHLQNCMDPGQMATETQSQLPIQLDAPGAADRARRHWPSNSDSPFRPRPNYAVPSGLYGCPGRKLSSVLTALLFAVSSMAQATIINATSPSLANITAAIASAVDGDTVIVPAGTASWTSGLSITKGITLMGQTTTDPVAKTSNDQTIILDNVVRGPGGTPIIKVRSTLGKSYRISGITFRPGTVTDTNYNGLIHLEGNSHTVRLDHCHFATMIYQPVDIATYGAIYGVIDHNVLEFFSGSNESIFMTAATWGGLINSYGSWAEPAYYGSEKFLFIEDNCFNNNQTGHELAGTLDSERGARWVFRYNHCYNTEVQSHGTEGDQERGSRAIEVYNNDFHLTESTQFGQIRTGSIIVHDNTFDGAVPASGMVLETYRAFFAYRSGPWAGSSGDNVWDVNATEADGTHVNGHSPYLFESGTVTSGNTTTLTDTTKSWTTNQWVGFTAKRASDIQIAYIQSNTSNTLRVYYYNDSGRGATWTAGDQYQIHKVLISLDQPGRGQGDLLTGDTPIDSVTGTATWPHQALEPCYSWNDIYTPNGTHLNLQAGTGNQVLLLQGRDFYNNTSMPGYTPYTYPHPLVSGGGHGPETPGRLHVPQ